MKTAPLDSIDKANKPTLGSYDDLMSKTAPTEPEKYQSSSTNDLDIMDPKTVGTSTVTGNLSGDYNVGDGTYHGTSSTYASSPVQRPSKPVMTAEQKRRIQHIRRLQAQQAIQQRDSQLKQARIRQQEAKRKAQYMQAQRRVAQANKVIDIQIKKLRKQQRMAILKVANQQRNEKMKRTKIAQANQRRINEMNRIKRIANNRARLKAAKIREERVKQQHRNRKQLEAAHR